MKKSILASVILSGLMSTFAFADSETKAYVGLNWYKGGGTMPELVLGVADTKTQFNGDTKGVNLVFHLKLAGGLAPSKLRLSALNGKEDLQGELGIGYNFLTSDPYIGLGLNAPHLAIGVDGYRNAGLVPYATVHSLDKFKKPLPTATPDSTPNCPELQFWDPIQGICRNT
ncbi:MAG: hypothetical protein WCH35_17925 [Comamonadaceae bacterium]